MPLELTYNGITLEIINVTAYDERPIFDGEGKTYLYTRHTLDLQCVFNPRATAYDHTAVGTAPFASPGVWATKTAAAVRHALLQARKQLVYRLTDETGGLTDLLRSPLTYFTLPAGDTAYLTDAANGPTPLRCLIRPNHGLKTFKVQYTIQTDLNECDRFYGGESGSGAGAGTPGPSPLLSHRWQMVHGIDGDFYTIRTIHGRAVLRTDRAIRDNYTPDSIRAFLLAHPIPVGFKRIQSSIRQGDGANVLEYTLVDREMALSVVALGGVTRIEAYETIQHKIISPNDALFGLGEAIGRVPGVLANPEGATGIIGGYMHSVVPNRLRTIVIKVWGRQNSSRKNLLAVAQRVALLRIGNADRTPSYEYTCTHDVTGRFVELRVVKIMGVFAQAIAGLGTEFEFNDSDEVDGILHVNNTNVAPPNDSGTRGTYTQALQSPALHEACTLHPVPPATPAAAPMDPVPPEF